MQETYLYETDFNLSGTLHFVEIICGSCNEAMPASIKIQQKANIIINNERDSAAQTALTGSTVYSLPKRTPNRNMVDLVLMIMDEDGPMPMYNMRPAKKTRNAANQFYDEHQVEYETRGQSARDQIDRVHTHNNAYPKMYDELDKRRSIAQVGMTGLGGCQAALRTTPAYSSNENVPAKFDPTCPKCIKRKKRVEKERKRRGPLCKKCRDALNRKESKNKLDRVTKNKIPKPKKQQTRCRSTKASKPSIICSNKCFQCYLTAETKTVSTFKSNDNLLPVPPEVTPPKLTPSTNIKENQEKNVLKTKSSHKKILNKKPPSLKSDVNTGNPETETRPSVSSYNSFMSTEHEPMVE